MAPQLLVDTQYGGQQDLTITTLMIVSPSTSLLAGHGPLLIVEIVIVLNPDRTIKMVNNSTLKILNFNEEDLIGKRLGILLAKEANIQATIIELNIEKPVEEHSA